MVTRAQHAIEELADTFDPEECQHRREEFECVCSLCGAEYDHVYSCVDVDNPEKIHKLDWCSVCSESKPCEQCEESPFDAKCYLCGQRRCNNCFTTSQCSRCERIREAEDDEARHWGTWR